jgi:uncharacterized membrane protein
MRFPKLPIAITLTIFFASWSVWAQDREVEIHKNVKLVVTSATPDIPAGIAGQYQVFLQLLESVLKETVSDQTDECALTFKVMPVIKEIGAAKTKRAAARITAYRRNSRQEYFGNLILYSYVNSGPVNKEETQEFLQKQILQPSECR